MIARLLGTATAAAGLLVTSIRGFAIATLLLRLSSQCMVILSLIDTGGPVQDAIEK